MKKLTILLILTLSCFHSFAMVIKGDIHPERYTFFLNKQGAEALKNINNLNIKLREKPGNIPLLKELENNVNKIGINSDEDPIWKKGNIRWDDKPPVALTCLISTMKNPIGNFYQDITHCADETGAEYIGLKGWPVQQALEKVCKVGQLDCPVYLVLQGDDPMARNDSVQFSPRPSAPVSVSPKKDMAEIERITSYLKGNGCTVINDAMIKKGSSNDSDQLCAQVTKVGGDGPYYSVYYKMHDGYAGEHVTIEYKDGRPVWFNLPNGTLRIE
ncbi:hypothetical protein IG611_11735 [Pectobacterium sp. A535-S3-A17]|uniref:hypothetical protein n=1 Tax=Pectobacterium quasiaquaticum TaxID=2774015 RepID=UPI001876C1A6|nr:hypothetical protein [Pectobacterium quasiaquaticum]MBE5215826.1 hypothetical protein [Pectobacterium quasiaquaticum]MBE5226021.1 hypothetical protein [Pectobacterium quasiaquaticum]